MEDYKTSCCKSGVIRKGRANYICGECGSNMTMEIYYIVSLDKNNKY